ncbi:MAG: helix-turn-helix domain-containing protein [Gemmatimonas sp.]
MQSPADLLRKARSRSGLTQRQLAERAGTTQSVVARIENGSARLLLQTLSELIAATGLKLSLSLEETVPEQTHMLSDTSRILALTPEQRLEELANSSRFFASAVRV